MLKFPSKMAGQKTSNIALGIVLLSVAFSIQMAEATHHHVAEDDKGWDISSDLAAWASARLFKVGDNIWFDSTASQESLIELESMNEFSSCDLKNPIKMYTEGINRVSLDGEGSRYFVSGDTVSCKKGLKLHINVHPSKEDESHEEGATSSEYKDATNPYGSSEDEDVPEIPEPSPSPKPKPKPKPPHKAPPPEELDPDSPPEPLFPPPELPPPTPSSSTLVKGHFFTMVAAFCWIAI